MYEPWDGCVWIHSNRVLTYHLLHWQRAMMDNPIIFYYTVAPLPPLQKYTAQMSNIRYFTIKVSKSNIWQTSNDTIKLLLVSKIPHCYPFASKQQFNWSARHFSCCLLQFWIRSNRLPGVGVDKRPGVVVAVRMKSDIIHYDIIHVFFLSKWNLLTLFLWPVSPWAQWILQDPGLGWSSGHGWRQ